MGENSGATAIASVPKIDIGLEKAVMLEMFIMAQIRVKHVSFLVNKVIVMYSMFFILVISPFYRYPIGESL